MDIIEAREALKKKVYRKENRGRKGEEDVGRQSGQEEEGKEKK